MHLPAPFEILRLIFSPPPPGLRPPPLSIWPALIREDSVDCRSSIPRRRLLLGGVAVKIQLIWFAGFLAVILPRRMPRSYHGRLGCSSDGAFSFAYTLSHDKVTVIISNYTFFFNSFTRKTEWNQWYGSLSLLMLCIYLMKGLGLSIRHASGYVIFPPSDNAHLTHRWIYNKILRSAGQWSFPPNLFLFLNKAETLFSEKL